MKNIHKFVYLLIQGILVDVAAENLLIQEFYKATHITASVSIIVFLILVILISPFQSGLSDIYCRKKSLLVALILSCISLVPALFNDSHPSITFIILMIGFKIFGNITPISWAAIADVQKKELRFALGIATTPYALGYLILTVLKRNTSPLVSFLFFIIYYLIIIILDFIFYEDPRDKRNHLLEATSSSEEENGILKKIKSVTILIFRIFKFEKKEIHSQLKNKTISSGLLAYYFWSLTIYSPLILLTDFKNRYSFEAIIMMGGYLIGIALLKIVTRFRNDSVIKIGYLSSFVSFIFFTLFFIKSEIILLTLGSFFLGMGNAYFSPTILTILSKTVQKDSQGRIFGLIESTDTLGLLCIVIEIMIFNTFSLNIFHVVVLAGVFLILSIFPYRKNYRLRKLLKN